ncbi:hypothetical protein BACIH_2478 [Bacillus amyloliquefaciens]|nr:hypothetical protein U471_24990 [Bacillus amyloliquefaciens CC178]QEY91070.1 hypothetical protein BACIT_3235 [Bacillus amyloliquefaciens]QEY94189.1 hypothetical protein BACIH_2478 [Bacillus amyloliquefaciens]
MQNPKFKDSSDHFNGAVFLYRFQFLCCEVIYFRQYPTIEK